MAHTVQSPSPQADSAPAESQPASAYKPTPKFGSLDTPEETQPIEMYWTYAIALVLVHVLALVAFIPGIFGYLFTWTGLSRGRPGAFRLWHAGGHGRLPSVADASRIYLPQVVGTHLGDSWHL